MSASATPGGHNYINVFLNCMRPQVTHDPGEKYIGCTNKLLVILQNMVPNETLN